VKIGVNTLFYIPGQVGGSETYLLEILQAWKHGGADAEVVLFTNRENHTLLSDRFAGEGWACRLCDFAAENRVVRIVREQVELPRRVKRSGVDVLWSPGYTAPFISVCPQVVSILDMQYKRFPEDLGVVGRWTTEVLVQAAARRAAHLLTISAFSREEIVRFTPASPERITVTPLAADSAFGNPVAGDVPVPEPFLLCVANSYPHKNVDQLVRAFGRVMDRIPHSLVLVGHARLGEASVAAAVSEVLDPDRVLRLSGLSREELIRLYQRAEVFVFPSKYEGFGLPVLEALTAGTPVLTTCCGSLPEVGGEMVATFDPAADSNLEAALLALPSLPDGVGEHLSSFTWANTARDTLECLKRNAV